MCWMSRGKLAKKEKVIRFDDTLHDKEPISEKRKPAQLFIVAERQGFEPWMELSPHTRLAGERLQPARPSLQKNFSKIFLYKITQ